MSKIFIETHVEEAAKKSKGLLRSKYGIWILSGLSFIESALPVPIITDPFLVVYILSDKKSAYKGVMATIATSVLGGVFAYMVAFYFYEFIAYTYLDGSIGRQFYAIVDRLREGTFAMTLIGALTPVPYTLVAMGAGFIKGNLLLFIIASIIGRGLRFAVVGWITYKFGEQALKIIRGRLMLMSVIVIIFAILFLFYKL